MESRKIDLVVPAPKLERPHVDKPVYITPEEPDSLHADRSPYDFEPADTKESSLNPEVEFFQSGLIFKFSRCVFFANLILHKMFCSLKS